jgi:hypothetical protein
VNEHYPPATSAQSPKHNVINYVLPYVEQGNLFANIDLTQDWNSSANKPYTQVNLPLVSCPSSPRRGDYTSDYLAITHIWKNSYSPSPDAYGNRIFQELVGVKVVDRGPQNPSSGSSKWEGVLQSRLNTVGGIVIETRITPAHVRDGTSNTFLLFEDSGRPSIYSQGRKLEAGTITFDADKWASDTNCAVIQYSCNLGQLMNCKNYDEVFSFHTSGCSFAYADGSVHFHDEGMDPEVFTCLFTRAAGDIANMNGL